MSPATKILSEFTKESWKTVLKSNNGSCELGFPQWDTIASTEKRFKAWDVCRAKDK